ncbi:MAG TPA: hypothetical protein VF997_22100 [Polyangia bacterium]
MRLHRLWAIAIVHAVRLVVAESDESGAQAQLAALSTAGPHADAK